MRKIYNYIMLAVFVFAAASCIDEIGNTDIPSAETGDEVQFGLSLPDVKTRTVYGGKTQITENNITKNVFPIYWANNDKVQIFSPQASEGRNNAEYEVILPSVENPNYADDLVKTGSYGVQWGEGYEYIDDKKVKHTGVHDFYSIYPSGQYEFYEDDTDGSIWAQGVQISSMQNIEYSGSGFVYDMNNCVMYAKTPKVDKGHIANLNYKPLSTVLWVTLTVDKQDNTQPELKKGFQILGITLQTDDEESYIAGTCEVNVSNGELNVVNGRDKIQIVINDKTSDQEVKYTIPAGGTLSFPIFLAPGEMDINGWKIIISTDQGTYTKTLASSENEKKLEAGQIHEINLPTLSLGSKEWDVSHWMTYIPRNVYLSEVSIPGTWNSLNVDCQSNTSISDQYDLGVRAFHLDTRWRSDNNPYLGSNFTGISKPNITKLSVATGGSSKTNSYEGGNLMKADASATFAEHLAAITDEVQEDEYMVVFCTFAQNSYNGDRCPSTWYEAVSDACADNDAVYNASLITANTLVGDVLGKVIVIVNLESTVSSITLPDNSKCLFTYIPMQLPQNYYTETSHLDALYYSSQATSGISMYTAHAQISTTGTSKVDCGDRGYSHPLSDRDELVETIWDWSKNNYSTDNYKHNTWIYLGLGGYIMTSSSSSGTGYHTIENRYAPKIYDRISEMNGSTTAPFYPIGIVLMNNKLGSNYTGEDGKSLGYGFSDVCKKILQLNNKYTLQYDKTKPSDYDGKVDADNSSGTIEPDLDE